MYVNKGEARTLGEKVPPIAKQTPISLLFADLISFLSSFPVRPLLSFSLLHTPTTYPKILLLLGHAFIKIILPPSLHPSIPFRLRLAFALLLLLLLRDGLLQNLRQFSRLEKRGHNIATAHKLSRHEQLGYGRPFPKISGGDEKKGMERR